MAKRKRGDSWAGVALGPLIVALAVTMLWNNETRFDYHRAASYATPVRSLEEAVADETIAYTGSLDRDLEIPGEYVERFRGKLVVYRNAEIYCWSRREDDEDGSVTWSLRWLSAVEDNHRNNSITRELRSGMLLPAMYRIGDLTVETPAIEFVDPAERLNHQLLVRTTSGQRLQPSEGYLYLRKSGTATPDQLGDERVSYSAIAAAEPVTYFGRYSDGRGVADTTHRRDGFVNKLIQDSGVLHHLVNGDRRTALATMRIHLSRRTWLVRGLGTGGTVFGFSLFFGSLLRFLFHVPVIGWLASRGVVLLSVAVGLPVACVTIAAGSIASQPVVVVVLGAVLFIAAVAGYRSWQRDRLVRQSMWTTLEQEAGRAIDQQELKEREFLQLAELATVSHGLRESEQRSLETWAKKNGWSAEKRADMLARARAGSNERFVITVGAGLPAGAEPLHSEGEAAESSREIVAESLEKLVRLAVADGGLTAYEMRAIVSAARKVGYSSHDVHELIASTRRTAGHAAALDQR